ncbi:ABC transporter permease [Dactylosporangium sp. AC04546]|uniref:ABC transporter permease n=1 Tax=Dactylosporangium sp. AC04546 TaxID=2862460 RepID=UPI001EE02CF3|nr:ABC transporter permease [Dactylosporangium sp. AC04546]WVK87163.1 ABC transporter permease [Dactylosporangium sp. AC04546]
MPTRRDAGRLARRAAIAIVQLWGAATLCFATLHLIPGDPVDIIMGNQALVSPELKAQVRAEYGLDDPVAVQYLRLVAHLARGDLGTSYQLQRPVWGALAEQVLPTVQLAGAALLLAVLLAVGAAVLVPERSRVARALFSGLEMVAVSLPQYWLGILLITFLSLRWHLFPVIEAGTWRSLVLPAVAVALPIAGTLAQVLREELDTALAQPFVTAARARGAGALAVRTGHALRHCLVPATTLTGWFVGSLLGGSVLIEQVFGRPGLGQVALTAVTNKDLPMVTGVVMLAAAVFVAVNLLVEASYLVIDPRVRRDGT